MTFLRSSAAAFALLHAFLLTPAPALATDTEELWTLGFGLNWSYLGTEERTADGSANDVFIDASGIGATVTGGYGINANMAIRGEASLTQHDTDNPDIEVIFTTAALEGLWIARDMETFRPYVMGGVACYSLESRETRFEFETTGYGILAGGGFYYFFSDNFALDASIRGDFINWDTIKARVGDGGGTTLEASAPIDESGSVAKISAGAAWWF